MKIHYNPYFNGDYYLDFKERKNFLFDELVVGNTGLLAELELRGGYSCECLSGVEREANYYNVVRKVVQAQPGCFIKDSFTIDEYGVASELLSWRDELVFAGWNPGMKGISAKLDFLAEMENLASKENINIKGVSDRWRIIMNSHDSILRKDDELIIHFPNEHLDPCLVHFFDKLSESGISCKYKYPSETMAPKGTNLEKVQQAFLNQTIAKFDSKDKDSFRVYRFGSQISALEWVGTQKYLAGTVFINSDNRSFENVQMLFGYPLSGSSLTDANPEIVQLFKLGCSLFIRPLNVYNLLSYLQISVHPLPSLLRRNLIDVIIKEGGIVNAQWQKVINDFVNVEDKKKAKSNAGDLVFLPLNLANDKGINTTDLQNYVKQLKVWADQKLVIISREAKGNNDEMALQQLLSLRNFCSAFLIILNGENRETISNDNLRSWILSIYKPTNYHNTEAQAQSRMVIGSPAAMVDTAEEAVWMDCNNGVPDAVIYSFLNTQEREALIKNGVIIWSEERQIKAQLYEQRWAVLNCRSKISLVVSGKDRGEKLKTHPIMVQLAAQFENLDSIETIDPEPEGNRIEITQQALPKTPVVIEMNEKDLFSPPEHESYSSLHDLIQNPLDYVLKYQAKLYGPGVVELGEDKPTMGNVAHLFIEQLVNDSEKDLQKMKQKMANDFEDRFGQAVLQKGAVLLLDENKITLARFAYQIRQSVNALISIIENNKLKIRGCEVSVEGQLNDKFRLEARIDMLLSDSNNNNIIFDMKWTSSKTLYKNLISENKALQLAVYKKALLLAEPGREVTVLAYFNLSLGVLETACTLNGSHINIIVPDNNNNIFQQAINSYSYRWVQLQNGEIEVADQMKTADIVYVTDESQRDLYPLETDYNYNNLKAVNTFSDYTTFKGDLK